MSQPFSLWVGVLGELEIDLGWRSLFQQGPGDQCAVGVSLVVAGPTGWPQSHAGQMFQTELDPAASSFLPWEGWKTRPLSALGSYRDLEVGSRDPEPVLAQPREGVCFVASYGGWRMGMAL